MLSISASIRDLGIFPQLILIEISHLVKMHQEPELETWIGYAEPIPIFPALIQHILILVISRIRNKTVLIPVYDKNYTIQASVKGDSLILYDFGNIINNITVN